MKKKYHILFFFLLCNNLILAQKEDYMMFNGYDSEIHNTHPDFGNLTFDFNHNPLSITYQYQQNVDFSFAHASICTPEGRLLFYSDGIQVLDRVVFKGKDIRISSKIAL
jgi:hypothetical protein